MSAVCRGITWMLTLAATVALCASAGAQLQTLPYSATFDSPAYSFATVDGQNGWEVDTPASGTVQRQKAYRGDGAVKVDSGAMLNHLFEPTDPATVDSVWIDGFQRATPSLDLPDLSALSSGSAVVAFSATSGIVAFSYWETLDDQGNELPTPIPVWAESGIMVNGTDWTRITINLQMGARTYDVYVNGVRPIEFQGLTFLNSSDPDSDQFRGFQLSAGDEAAYLDHIGFATAPPADLTPPPANAQYTRYFGFDSGSVATGSEGWIVAGNTGFDQATYGYSSGRLRIGANTQNTFGYWSTIDPAHLDVVIESMAGSVHELIWDIASGTDVLKDVPLIRARINTKAFQVASILSINSFDLGPQGNNPGYIPGTAGHEYRQYVQLPDAIVNDGYYLSFDAAWFVDNPFVQVFLDDVTIWRHPAEDLAGGSLVSEYNFTGDTEGWTFFEMPAPFTVPSHFFNTVSDSLELALISPTYEFGFWFSSPNENPIVLGGADKLYRGDFTVSSQAPTQADCPRIRFRLNTNLPYVNEEVDVTTLPGDAGQASPGATPVTYSVFMHIPAGRGVELANPPATANTILMSYDIIGLGAEAAEVGNTVSLSRAALYIMDPPL